MSNKKSIATINLRGAATPRDVVTIIEGIEVDYDLNYELYNGEIEVLKNE